MNEKVSRVRGCRLGSRWMHHRQRKGVGAEARRMTLQSHTTQCSGTKPGVQPLCVCVRTYVHDEVSILCVVAQIVKE